MRQWIRTVLVWLAITIAIGGVTLAACGSFRPILYGTGYPDYNALQWGLFFVARAYAWPVTTLFSLLREIVPCDVFVSPFMLEVADLKIGPGIAVFYVLFYSSVTQLVRRVLAAALHKRAGSKTASNQRVQPDAASRSDGRDEG